MKLTEGVVIITVVILQRSLDEKWVTCHSELLDLLAYFGRPMLIIDTVSL